MNYISHYFLDAIPGNPYFNFGLVLPDMMTAVQKGWKPLPSHLATDNDLARGVRAHLGADRLFHNSPFFKEETARLGELFQEHSLALPGIRLFFVTHIFLEMMLDRIVMRNRPEVAPAFYDGLEELDESRLSAIIYPYGPPLGDRFPLFFARFKEHRYLLSYLQNDGLFFAMNRTLNRTGQPAFPEENFPQFAALTEEVEEELTEKVFPFFEEMRERNNEQ